MSEDHLLNLINDFTWDAPFFKTLAPNDTGNGRTHQGGPLIPKDLRQYFPTLDETLLSPGKPVIGIGLTVELYDGGRFLASKDTHYRFQTRMGKRTPEGRVTGNLDPQYKMSSGGDVLIMQRSRDRTEAYRFFLIRKGTDHFRALDPIFSGRNWGALYDDNPPLSRDELLEATEELFSEAGEPFIPVRHSIPRSAISRDAIARDTAFREVLLEEYSRKCSVSGIAMATRTTVEAEAVHVVGLGFGGADEPRNGFLLTRTLHWSFDQGLFGIDDTRCVVVPEAVQQMPENEWLIQYQGRKIRDAKTQSLRTSPLAFAWHRENLLARWD